MWNLLYCRLRSCTLSDCRKLATRSEPDKIMSNALLIKALENALIVDNNSVIIC